MINNERIAIGKKTLGYAKHPCVPLHHLRPLIMQISESYPIPEPEDVQRYHEWEQPGLWHRRLLGRPWMGLVDIYISQYKTKMYANRQCADPVTGLGTPDYAKLFKKLV